METSETIKPLKTREVLKQWEIEGNHLVAAMGFQGLAMRANNRTLAEAYFDESVESLTNQCNIPDSGGIPEPERVLAKAALNLAPITHDLTVKRRISSPDAVKAVFKPFIDDLGKDTHAASKLISGKQPEDPELYIKRSSLISVIGDLATLGLGMKFQFDVSHSDELQFDVSHSDEWQMAIAFLEPELISYDNPKLLTGYWALNVFTGYGDQLKLSYKCHVRNSSRSPHRNLTDPETSVIYIHDDLALPEDPKDKVEISIVRDLRSKTQKGEERTRQRIDSLLDAINDRTLGAIWDSVPHDSMFS